MKLINVWGNFLKSDPIKTDKNLQDLYNSHRSIGSNIIKTIENISNIFTERFQSNIFHQLKPTIPYHKKFIELLQKVKNNLFSNNNNNSKIDLTANTVKISKFKPEI